MGYSLSVATVHPARMAAMLSFLDSEYRGVWSLLKEAPERGEWESFSRWSVSEIEGTWRDRVVDICVGDEIAYGAAKSKVGFNFSSSGGASGQWMYRFLRWVSLKVGRPRITADARRLGILTPFPYITYDSEPTPVIPESRISEVPEEARESAYRWGWVVDETGRVLPWPESPPTREQILHFLVTETYARYFLKERARECLVDAVIDREIARLDAAWGASCTTR